MSSPDEPAKDVYINTGEGVIFITTKWRPDPDGGPAIRETTYVVKPGEGIDLSILGLKRREEKEL